MDGQLLDMRSDTDYRWRMNLEATILRILFAMARRQEAVHEPEIRKRLGAGPATSRSATRGLQSAELVELRTDGSVWTDDVGARGRGIAWGRATFRTSATSPIFSCCVMRLSARPETSREAVTRPSHG